MKRAPARHGPEAARAEPDPAEADPVATDAPQTEREDPFGGLEPLVREPASEKVARQILELVRTGNLVPGERLPSEHELSRVFQVSRPTIREALRGLSLMGIVEVRHGGGARVNALSARQLVEPIRLMLNPDTFTPGTVFRARKAVEAALVRDATARISPDRLARLRELVAAGHDLVDDPVGFRVLDLEFHSVLNAAAENPLLSAIADTLYAFAMDYRRIATETPGVTRRSADDHAAVVEAIAARDADAAAARMLVHIDNIERTTLAAMRRAAAGGEEAG